MFKKETEREKRLQGINESGVKNKQRPSLQIQRKELWRASSLIAQSVETLQWGKSHQTATHKLCKLKLNV